MFKLNEDVWSRREWCYLLRETEHHLVLLTRVILVCVCVHAAHVCDADFMSKTFLSFLFSNTNIFRCLSLDTQSDTIGREEVIFTFKESFNSHLIAEKHMGANYSQYKITFKDNKQNLSALIQCVYGQI